MSIAAPVAVTTEHALITPAIADLERHLQNSPCGEVASLAAPHWTGTFIKTARFGWLRLPDALPS